jgi:H+/Cl- antiporter ClcA
MMPQRFHQTWLQLSDRARLHLSRPDALFQLSVLGLLAGLIAGAVIVVFRLGVEGLQESLLPAGKPENYEGLAPLTRLLFPVAGGILIGGFFFAFGRGLYVLGVARVMERLSYHQGYLSVREFILQFVGAALAIISGHSVGREGPHIFLGAASGSLLGQALSLPNNSIRTLVGCGVAAGISASFNTPLAGVIFALEVVMMEYTFASFIPVILAAVSADAVSVMFFGADPAFLVPAMNLGSLAELPLVLLLGVVTGAFSAGYVHILERTGVMTGTWPFWIRTTLAGLVVGACGLLVPQVMGIGYDTVDAALFGELGIGLLVSLILLKLVATTASIGMGIPGGVIGPSLVMGAAIGSLVAILVDQLFPEVSFDAGTYALLGMGALMGASLQAPLAALTAMMELTHNPQIIMPGMLVVVVASLTSREVFRKPSLFIAVLRSGGLDYKANPVMQALRRAGVASVMSRNFVRHERTIDVAEARKVLAEKPEWVLVEGPERPRFMLPALDLAGYVEQQDSGDIDLMQFPARRLEVAPVEMQATLQEALDLLDSGAEALYVQRMTAPGIRRIYGVLTREQVESGYRD